jgi:hypothetical protein
MLERTETHSGTVWLILVGRNKVANSHNELSVKHEQGNLCVNLQTLQRCGTFKLFHFHAMKVYTSGNYLE